MQAVGWFMLYFAEISFCAVQCVCPNYRLRLNRIKPVTCCIAPLKPRHYGALQWLEQCVLIIIIIIIIINI